MNEERNTDGKNFCDGTCERTNMTTKQAAQKEPFTVGFFPNFVTDKKAKVIEGTEMRKHKAFER